ncbi:MAG: hypothetical protein GXP35_09825 [Actinobacteria bacterium]|nr:hypothetical protein [Actinomycetota bacterium]
MTWILPTSVLDWPRLKTKMDALAPPELVIVAADRFKCEAHSWPNLT